MVLLTYRCHSLQTDFPQIPFAIEIENITKGFYTDIFPFCFFKVFQKALKCQFT